MHIASFKSFAFALVLATLPATVFAAAPSSVEQQITAAEHAMNAAYGANDLDKYFSYYADDMSAIFYNERTTLPEYRKSWTASVKAGNIVTSVKLSDMHVRVLPGDSVAIASFQIEVGNKHADGKTTSEKAFETDVWVKHKDGWKVVHAHYALAVPAAG
jgi:ketosteroid isomerase-like protein